jgi:hypothetical protein
MRPYVPAGPGPAVDQADAAAVLHASVGMISMPAELTLAADVSGRGDLSGSDAALILRRIQGDNQPFPASTACSSDWMFFPQPAPAANQLVTPPALSLGDCTPGAVSYQPVSASASGQDFTAILLGNADGN